MNLENICNQVCSLTVTTADWISRESGKIGQENIEVKGKNNFVTYVDKTSEQQLVKGLKSILPEAGFITEEGSANDEGIYRWVIDPLDGTTNFIHKLPPYSISIGLIDSSNEIILGVVYNIAVKELFYAWKDGGAFLNGSKIKVSNVLNIEDSLIATGFPYTSFEKIAGYMESLKYFFEHSHGVRRLGSAAIDLAYVACGRFDIFYEYNLNPWDVAAGSIIVREAGGKVSDFKGGNNFLFGKELIASNNYFHDNFVYVINKYL
jgi:myo-inositol-1(or 4)-monophosphatase